MKEKSPKRPMTEDEITVAKLLQQVTYPVASWDKRFARCIGNHLAMTPPMIGTNMVPQLWRLVQRYRRQIVHPDRPRFLRLSAQLGACDLRKLAKLRRQQEAEQARYAEAINGKPLVEVFAKEEAKQRQAQEQLI